MQRLEPNYKYTGFVDYDGIQPLPTEKVVTSNSKILKSSMKNGNDLILSDKKVAKISLNNSSSKHLIDEKEISKKSRDSFAKEDKQN